MIGAGKQANGSFIVIEGTVILTISYYAEGNTTPVYCYAQAGKIIYLERFGGGEDFPMPMHVCRTFRSRTLRPRTFRLGSLLTDRQIEDI